MQIPKNSGSCNEVKFLRKNILVITEILQKEKNHESFQQFLIFEMCSNVQDFRDTNYRPFFKKTS